VSGKRLAVVDDPFFDEHRAPEPHPERPERLAAARRATAAVAARSGRLDVLVRPATHDELSRVHTSRYIEQLGRAAGDSLYWDEDTYSAPKSVDVALRAAGGAVELVETLLSGQTQRGVALLRPPGHHARPDGAMGFCFVNNVAVAAAHARARGVERVLVVDFDVHHGNGTQEMFYATPEVLFVSLHQYPFYPGSGAAKETGSGDGRGYTVNVPLGPQATDETYAAAFDRIVAPLASEFAPGLVLLSAGFDAHRDDPLGQMSLTEAGYRGMTRRLVGALPKETPIAAILEGGYDLAALEASLTATLEVLTNLDTAAVPSASTGGVNERHGAEIALAERTAAEFWTLG
jgi:acetoin utilization deacetylase AcuC-like enzyme